MQLRTDLVVCSQFTFPETDSVIDATINDLRLNIVNLVPTMCMFNRTQSVVTPFGSFNKDGSMLTKLVCLTCHMLYKADPDHDAGVGPGVSVLVTEYV